MRSPCSFTILTFYDTETLRQDTVEIRSAVSSSLRDRGRSHRAVGPSQPGAGGPVDPRLPPHGSRRVRAARRRPGVDGGPPRRPRRPRRGGAHRPAGGVARGGGGARGVGRDRPPPRGGAVRPGREAPDRGFPPHLLPSPPAPAVGRAVAAALRVGARVAAR